MSFSPFKGVTQMQNENQNQNTLTCEQWLNAATKLLAENIFKPKGYLVPFVKVSTGFTGTKSGLKAIGSCWYSDATDDKVPQIFISPVLSDSARVMDVLAHELIHAMFPMDGHKKMFKRCALAIGLTGKMTATVASPELTERLNTLLKMPLEDGTILGPYPHAKLHADRFARAVGGQWEERKNKGHECLKWNVASAVM